MSLPDLPPILAALLDEYDGREREMIETALVRRDRSGYLVPAEALAMALNGKVGTTTIKLYRRTVLNKLGTDDHPDIAA